MCIMCAAKIVDAGMDVMAAAIDRDYMEGCEITIIVKTPKGAEVPYVVSSMELDITRLPAMLEDVCDTMVRAGATVQ